MRASIGVALLTLLGGASWASKPEGKAEEEVMTRNSSSAASCRCRVWNLPKGPARFLASPSLWGSRANFGMWGKRDAFGT